MKHKKYKAKIYKDSWCIDYSFHRWLLPRLKCFVEYNNGYPDIIKESFEAWQNEVKQMIQYLEYLVYIDDTRQCHKVNHLTDIFWNDDKIMEHCSLVKSGYKMIDELRDTANETTYPNEFKQTYIFDALSDIFGKWFGENYCYLWW